MAKWFVQHQLAFYEVGTRRVLVSHLPPLARVLNTLVELLPGEDGAADACVVSPRRIKRGPPSKLERQLDAVAQLPKVRQKFVNDMLDTVLAQPQRQEAATAA